MKLFPEETFVNILIFLVSSILAASALASPACFDSAVGKRLLLCSIPDGNTTSAEVVENEKGRYLVETLTTGLGTCRLLSEKEWQTRTIRLKSTSPQARATLAFDGGRWFFQYRNGNYQGSGFAPCD